MHEQTDVAGRFGVLSGRDRVKRATGKGKGKFGAAHVAVAAGRAHVIKTGIGKTAYIAAAVAAKDDNDSLAHNAAYGNPFETMDLGEEIRDRNEQIGALDLVERGVCPASPAIREAAKSA